MSRRNGEVKTFKMDVINHKVRYYWTKYKVDVRWHYPAYIQRLIISNGTIHP